MSIAATQGVLTPYERLERLGITLPEAPPPIGSFVTHVIDGKLMFLSGQGPREADGTLHRGKVGDTVTTEEAYAHARLTAVNLLSVMHHALGDLGRVRRIVKVLGMVNAEEGFADHPAVINGCSDLLMEVFGDNGPHARSAVGVASLPGQITVEVEAVIAIDG